MGRADLLRMEAEVVELEERLDAMKRERPRCKSCGRLKVVKGKSKLEDELRALKLELREKHQTFREARAKAAPVVVEK